MKILGKSDTHFIVEMTYGEMANLMGYDSEYSSPEVFAEIIRDEENITISKIYWKIKALQGAASAMEHVRDQLNDLASRLSPLSDSIREISDGKVGSEPA